MLAVLAVKLLEPWVTIRFGALFCSRVGHLAGNTECYLCERDAGINRPAGRVWDIWTPKGEPANGQLLKMFSRVMTISKAADFVNEVGSKTKNWKKHQFNDSQWGRDIYNLMEKSPPHLKFSGSEMRRGLEGLRSLGVENPESAKWVCIIVRDPIYLAVKEPAQDYSYHSFRDSDVQNYRLAAIELLNRGYYVFRMGVHVAGPMKIQATRFIDYAASGKRSDFMDVFLGAKCSFCISNSTGFDGIPMIFRRPILYVNEAPFEYLSTWMPDSLAIWKHHYRDGRRMTPAEIVISGAGKFFRSEDYAKAGITLVENTPEEIRDAAIEMADGLSGESQDWFWKSFPLAAVSPFNGVRIHGERRLRIGQKFLEQYRAH